MSPRILALLLAVFTVTVSSFKTCTEQELKDVVGVCEQLEQGNFELMCLLSNGSNLKVSVYAWKINHFSDESSGTCYDTLKFYCAGTIRIQDRSNGKKSFEPCPGVRSTTATSAIPSVTTDPPETSTSSLLSDDLTTTNSASENEKNKISLKRIVGGIGLAVIVLGVVCFGLYKFCWRQKQTRPRDPEAPQDQQDTSVMGNGHAGTERSAFLLPERRGSIQNNIEELNDRSENVHLAEEASSEVMVTQIDLLDWDKIQLVII